MENKLSNPNMIQKPITGDNMDLLTVCRILWRGKFIVGMATIIMGAASIVLAVTLPSIYEATAMLAPRADSTIPQVSGITQTITALAGGQGGATQVSKVDIVIGTLESRKFVLDFIKRHDIRVPLMAIQSWDHSGNTLTFDDSVYDIKMKKWVENDGKGPSDWDVYKEFNDNMDVSTDLKTGFVTLSFKFPDPQMAKQWVDWLIEDINQYTKEKDIEDAQESIEYLQIQLNKTSVTDIRGILFGMIQENIRTALLAETRTEYFLSTIDPAVAPEKPIRPLRLLIAIVGIVLGFFSGGTIVYFRHLFPKQQEI